ncbi:hypothetical protein [Streptomyces doudnae]|uniref:Methyl-accepting chemotaxis protein n=2 Tax=Streptomyces TaxID=1883 RepID=A0ABD5EUR9_9ACTN|nr:hypothetical protein [Streptomyces sp. DSM 41981]MDT0438461.1 hypothetical protein [Streptomyces sp. DSM 41981]
MTTASTPPGANFLDPGELGEKLAALLTAHPGRFTGRADELRCLAHDLKTDDARLNSWAEIDLTAAFVRPETLGAPPAKAAARRWWRRPPREGVLEAALGVLVFVPLLVTWFGLREAVRAYGALSRADPQEATRPFLQLWQTGFEGRLAPVGRFENVALTAVALISLLVLLSVWHARARSVAERREEQRQDEDDRLLGTLAALLTRVQVCLVPRRAASPQQFARELTNTAKQLQTLVQNARAGNEGLLRSAKAVGNATDALQRATTGLSAELPAIAEAARRVEDAVRAGAAATDRARADGEAAGRDLAAKIKAAEDGVRTAFSSLVAEQKALAAGAQQTARAAEQAAQAVVAGAGRTNDVVDGMREATERWDAAAAHWQDAAARLEQGIDTLTATASAAAPLPAPRNGAPAPGRPATEAFPGGFTDDFPAGFPDGGNGPGGASGTVRLRRTGRGDRPDGDL